MVNLSYTTMQRAANHTDITNHNVRLMNGSAEIHDEPKVQQHLERDGVGVAERSEFKVHDYLRDGGFFGEGHESVKPLQYSVGGSVGPTRNHRRGKDQAHVHILAGRLSE